MEHNQIRISKEKLINNFKIIRQYIGAQVKYLLPIKANAYGHGLLLVASIAKDYVDYFGVARFEEGVALRQAGIKTPILIFGSFSLEELPYLVEHDIELTIASQFKLNALINYCEQNNKTAKIHLKLETGMNRVGVRIESADELINEIKLNSRLSLIGVYSHLASCDEINNDFCTFQIQNFKNYYFKLKQKYPAIIGHIANSAAVLTTKDSFFDMVRPGILSYGYAPNSALIKKPFLNIARAFSLYSKVSYFKVVKKGAGISYNHRYILGQDTRIATVSIGYGDGLRRGLSNQIQVLIRGKLYPQVGTICMDSLMVDLGSTGEAYPGDEVVLIGAQAENEILLEDFANKLNTISYELLVGFNERIPRVLTQ